MSPPFDFSESVDNVEFLSIVNVSEFIFISPPFPSPQLKKQNDKESARDMTGYKPSNFDKGFRDGKGWGDLVRRAASPRFPPSRRNAFDESAKQIVADARFLPPRFADASRRRPL